MNIGSVSTPKIQTLCAAGHVVWVEKAAGEGDGFPDEAYRKAGARLASSGGEVFQEAELIVKVKEPLPVEYPSLPVGTDAVHLSSSRGFRGVGPGAS